MVAAANGVGGDGCVWVRGREKEQRGGASRKSERGPRWLRGVAGGNQGRRRQPGREVAGALRARATPRLCLLAEEEEDKGKGGLGRLGGELGRAGKQVSGPGGLFSLFLFLFSIFLTFV